MKQKYSPINLQLVKIFGQTNKAHAVVNSKINASKMSSYKLLKNKYFLGRGQLAQRVNLCFVLQETRLILRLEFLCAVAMKMCNFGSGQAVVAILQEKGYTEI